MTEVQIGIQNDQWMVIYRGRDLFTDTQPTEAFQLFGVHNLHNQAWQSVAVLTSQGVVIFEMQDDNWIKRMSSYPPNSREGLILPGRNFIPFGHGTIPNTFIDEFRDRPNQSPMDIFENHDNQVTIYLINGWNDVCFKGSDGMFFNTQGEPISIYQVSTLSTRITFYRPWSYYLIRLDPGGVAIAAFDRFGDLQVTSFVRGNGGYTLTEWDRILIPFSLQVENGRLEMQPMIENPAGTNSLDGGLHLTWEEYIVTFPEYDLYFVDQYLEAYLRNNEGFDLDTIEHAVYIRVSNGERLSSNDIPGGVVRRISLDISADTETILYIENGQATVYSIFEDRITDYSDLILVLTPELERQTRLWKLLGPDNGPLMRLFSSPGFDPSSYQSYTLINGEFVQTGPPRVTGLTSMFAPARGTRSPSPQAVRPRVEAVAPLFQESPPVQRSEQPTIRQIDIFNRQSLERFLSWYYPSPLGSLVEPDLLEDHARTSLSEISQLLSSGQVTRFESPPVMQPWAGPPGTPNRIFTFQIIDGRKLFVKAQYNRQTNQLTPSV